MRTFVLALVMITSISVVAGEALAQNTRPAVTPSRSDSRKDLTAYPMVGLMRSGGRWARFGGVMVRARYRLLHLGSKPLFLEAEGVGILREGSGDADATDPDATAVPGFTGARLQAGFAVLAASGLDDHLHLYGRVGVGTAIVAREGEEIDTATYVGAGASLQLQVGRLIVGGDLAMTASTDRVDLCGLLGYTWK